MPAHPPIDPSVVVWSADADAHGGRPLLVLLHGYGADERDLFGLVSLLPAQFVVASVRAPLSPPWPAPGYSWYAIDGMMAGDDDAAGVTAAASGLLDWLDGQTDAGGPVGLLGFSQGASVALQVLRLRPDRFAFAVNLAGFVAPGELARDDELAALRVPVFWGRGAVDPVIPQSLVEHTAQWLPAHAELSGRVYPGLGHAVSEEELADVCAFLERWLAAHERDAVTPQGGGDALGAE